MHLDKGLRTVQLALVLPRSQKTNKSGACAWQNKNGEDMCLIWFECAEPHHLGYISCNTKRWHPARVPPFRYTFDKIRKWILFAGHRLTGVEEYILQGLVECMAVKFKIRSSGQIQNQRERAGLKPVISHGRSCFSWTSLRRNRTWQILVIMSCG